MSFYNTTEVVRALEKWLATLTISDPTSPHDGLPLFEKVTKLDTPDLVEAAQKTIAVTERFCCVVPGEDRYSKLKDSPLTYQREQDFIFMLSATDFSPFQKEAFFTYGQDGDAKLMTGLIWMKDHLVNRLFGQPLKNLAVYGAAADPSVDAPEYTANFNCIFSPEGAKSARYTEDENSLTTIREGIILVARATMGEQQACLQRGTRRTLR